VAGFHFGEDGAVISREEKVELAWSFWQLQNERRPADAAALLHPDGGYRTICLPDWEAIPHSSGWLMKFIGVVLEMTGLEYQRGDALVDGDDVVLEFTSTFRLPDDEALHNQRYCMRMTLRDGLIFMINEYLDTKKEDPLITFVLAEIERRDGATV
jgi:hypothetical protein